MLMEELQSAVKIQNLIEEPNARREKVSVTQSPVHSEEPAAGEAKRKGRQGWRCGLPDLILLE